MASVNTFGWMIKTTKNSLSPSALQRMCSLFPFLLTSSGSSSCFIQVEMVKCESIVWFSLLLGISMALLTPSKKNI